MPSVQQPTDEALMQAFQQGDASAFEQLYRRYRSTLFRFLVRQVENTATGEDLYQETWMTLIRQRENWQPTASLKTYLYRIAHSRLVDHFRAQGRHGGFHTESLDADDAAEIVDACPAAQPEHALARRSDAQALRMCLERLPPEQREAFLFSEEAGLAVQDIAEITGIAAEAVKSRVRYAIRKLRQCLAGILELR